jgi:hypothetical protein
MVLPCVCSDPDTPNSRYPLMLETDFQTWQDSVVSRNAPNDSPIILIVNAVLAIGCYINQNSPGVQQTGTQAETYLSIALRARKSLMGGPATVQKIQASMHSCYCKANH